METAELSSDSAELSSFPHWLLVIPCSPSHVHLSFRLPRCVPHCPSLTLHPHLASFLKASGSVLSSH